MDFTDSYADHLSIMTERIDTALEESGFDSLLIYSGAPLRRYLDDQCYPFVCNPQFRSVVPAEAPHSWLCWRPGETPQLILYRENDFWHSPPQPPAGYWASHFEIRTIQSPEAARALLLRPGNTAVLGDCVSLAAAWELGELNPPGLLAHLDWHRAYKTPYEQDCLREASRIAVRGHLAAAKAFQRGHSEQQILLRYLRATGQRLSAQPYEAIIALDRHAATLHHTVLSQQSLPPTQRHSLLIDAGASSNGYAADISRSYAMRSGLFADLISALDLLQQDICSAVHPGGSFIDLHLTMHQSIGRLLQDFGLIRCSAETAVEIGLTRTFMPHGLGHHLGLQVHDVGGHQAAPEGGIAAPPPEHPFLRNTRIIEVDQVLTIEPGIYFIDMLLSGVRNSADSSAINWSVVDDFRPYGGARIEDNIVVHDDVVENLTRIALSTAQL